MTISMYQVSVPRFVHMLHNLAAILDRAQAYAEAKKIDATTLPAARRRRPGDLPECDRQASSAARRATREGLALR